MKTSFLSREELLEVGFASVGENILISKNACFYSPEKITIGDNVRIDDFCILSGKIIIGSYVHVAAYVALFAGKYKIELGNYSAVSSKSVIYAESDDYSGENLSNPTVPAEYRNPYGGDVVIGSHVVIGSGCTILPSLTIAEGVAVGAMSLVAKSLSAWNVYTGNPCRKLMGRSKKLLEYASKNERNSGKL